MTALDLTIPGEVVTILAEFGSNVTLTARVAEGEYDRATGFVNDVASVSGTVKGTPLYDYRPNEIDGQNVKSGDAQILISATLPTGVTEELLTGGTIAKGTASFTIVNFEKIESGDDVAAYILQLRK